MHLDLDHAVALTRLAATALHIEGEAAWLVAARLGFGQAGEPVADRAEGTGIGRRVGARRAADGRLVDIDDLVEMVQPFEALIGGRGLRGTIQLAGQRLVERLDDKRGLATPGDACNCRERAERDGRVDILEVVSGRAFYGQRAGFLLEAPLGRNGNLFLAIEEGAGEAVFIGDDLFRRPLADNLAAMDTGARAHIDDMVGREDGVFIMLHHEHRIAEVAQAFQCFQQAFIVALVKADGGFVEDIKHALKARADLAGKADALALAARQGAGCAR